MNNGRGEARRGHDGRPRAATSVAERRFFERDTARGDDGGCGGAVPHPPGAILTAPRRRPRVPPGAGPPDTHVSQEQRDAAHDRDRAPALRRETLVPAGDTREAAPHAPRGPRHWDGRHFCGRDARIPFTATCAACFLWHEFKNTLLPCRHDPDDPSPSWRDVRRFYLEDLDDRNKRPRRLACGQPAACPITWGSCSHCLPPATRTGREPALLRAHAGPPGAQLPVVRGAQEPAQRGGRDARD